MSMTFLFFPFEKLIAIECQILRCISSIQKSADENGFLFSTFKMVAVHFSQLYSTKADPDLKFDFASIPIVTCQ